MTSTLRNFDGWLEKKGTIQIKCEKEYLHRLFLFNCVKLDTDQSFGRIASNIA